MERNGEVWETVATFFDDRSDVQCQHRWTKVVNPQLVKGPWTKEVHLFSTRTGSSASIYSNYHTQTYEETASMNGTVQGERNERNRMATKKRRGELFTSGGRKDAKREGTRFLEQETPLILFSLFHSVEVKTAGKVRQERISNRGEKMGTYRDEKRRPELFYAARSSLPSLVPFSACPHIL